MKSFKFLLAAFMVIAFVSCKKSSTAPIIPIFPQAPVVSPTDPTIGQTFLNAKYGTTASQTMDVYLPAGRTSTTTKVIIMIHGGGWTGGDKADMTPFVDTLKNRFPDYAIFNLNYTLCNFVGNYFPKQELDVKAAVEYINQYRSAYFISNKFVLMGASAGAHLSLLHAYKYHTPVNIKAVVDFFGPTDMKDMYDNPPNSLPATTIALLVSGSVAGTPALNPSAYRNCSPLSFVNAQSCPTIILQGGTDLLVNHTRQSEPLRDKLTLNSVVNEYVYFPAGDHGGNWTVANYQECFSKIQAFLLANVL